MSRTICLCVLVSIASISPTMAGEDSEPRRLYPVNKPLKAGFLKVDSFHEIHYQLHGNPKGKPVFVLHGGPGFGCYPRLVQYFNPTKFLIVLHDQRGAGQSRPAGELKNNTTQDLVSDIERLRKHLKIDGKIMVFGGSWGSTLALAYAEAHPDHVSGMVLRGVFTAAGEEAINPFGGHTARQLFPDAIAALEAALPKHTGGFSPKTLAKIFSGDDEPLKQRVMQAWIKYAVKTGKLHATDEEVQQGFGDFDPFPGARIDCHYAMNKFFLEDDQLLRNADRLNGIPITLINGRYDVICPPINAYRLHTRLPGSKLIITEEAGHSEGEESTTQALLESIAAFESSSFKNTVASDPRVGR